MLRPLRALRPLLALLVATTALACGGTEDSSDVVVTHSTAGQARSRVLVGGETRLLAPGVGALVPLRYQIPDGDEERLSLRLTLGVAAGMGAVTTFVESPPIDFELDVGPINRQPAGGYRYEMKIRRVSLDLPEGTPDEMTEALSGELVHVGRVEGRVDVDDRGISREVLGRTPTAVPPRTQTMLGNIRTALQSIPFPEEPVGIGARWEVRRSIDQHTHDVDQVVTYELVDLEGQRGQLRVTIEQSADPQPLRNLPPGQSATLDSYVGRGTGEAVFDLTNVTPLAGVTFESMMHATTPDGGSGLMMETHSQVLVQPR